MMASRLSKTWPLVGGAIGLGSVLWGVWLMLAPQTAAVPAMLPPASPTTTPTNPATAAPTGAQAAGRTPLQGGSGTWTADAPSASQAGSPGALCPDCDIVVITMCSMRRDHVSAYGLPPSTLDGKPLTPALDALTAGGFRMDDAWAASNFTLAGLTALLTGRFGSSTGVTGWDKGLVKDVPTLPEILGYYGYTTGGFTIDAPSGFRPDYGLDRGFQRMEIIPPPRDTPDGRTSGGDIGPGGASAKPAAAWIAAQDKTKPIFAMFHTRTAHYPFVLEEDATDTTGVTDLLWGAGGRHTSTQAMPGTAGGTAQRGVVALTGQDPVQMGVLAAGAPGIALWKQRYAEAVGRMDIDLAVIAAALEKRGRLDKTIVVVLADHGESINDHGELLHGDAYFAGVVHIPLLIRVPGLKGGPVPALTSQVDVLPTLLDLVGAVTPADIDGSSMLPLFTGKAQSIRSATLVEGGVSWHDDGHPRGAVIAPPWAMLRQDRGCGGGPGAMRKQGEPATCLYDMSTDPTQDHNVAGARPDVTADLQSRWDTFRAAHAGPDTTLTLDPAYVEELQRTGYNFRPEEK